MPFAARVTDMTNHAGVVAGPGSSTVLIGGLPAAVVTDNHTCALPPAPHPPTPFLLGSTTVMVGGKPALRTNDIAGCGAAIVTGCFTVKIG